MTGWTSAASLLACALLLASDFAQAANRSQHNKPRRLAQLNTSANSVATRISTDNPDDARIFDAREAWQKHDRQRLASLKQLLSSQRHPLAAWVDYWELVNRLGEVGQDELEAFYARWPASYQEDRLRNDWLLELGRRRDWRNFAVEQPRFRMNDDREVTCYGLVVRHLLGEDVRQPARAAWLAQKEGDEGCRTMAQTLLANGVLSPSDLWARARLAAEHGRPRVMRQVLELLADLPAAPVPVAAPSTSATNASGGGARAETPGSSAPAAPAGNGLTIGASGATSSANAAGTNGASTGASSPPAAAAPTGNSAGYAQGGALGTLTPAALAIELFEQPPRFLARRGEALLRQPGGAELVALALARLAITEPAQAAAQLGEHWQPALRPETAAWAWSAVAKQGAQKFLPEAEAWFERAVELGQRSDPVFEWTDDTLAWRLRAALRATDPQRWQRVLQAVTRMSLVEQLDPTWVYWKARALLGVADPGPTGDGLRIAGQLLMERIAGQLNFYGLLASEQLGHAQTVPAVPAPSSEAERSSAANHPGLRRALAMIALGLNDEGRREWNYTLRELNDRELNAAARLACEREVWDRCIAAAERTRSEIDLGLRFPRPYRAELGAAVAENGLDAALVYGLIRQESRFSHTVRSGAGAAGLMQVITPTAKHVARQMGLKFHPDMLTDRSTNLRIGSTYLRMVLDEFGGSQALALAAYNAGPGRARRWREGPVLEVAAWSEMVPFNETRDYVKKVLSNAAYYSALIGEQPVASLRPRLSPAIGPRPPEAPPENRDLP
jgi:soluble lytic murein transglycosylase